MQLQLWLIKNQRRGKKEYRYEIGSISKARAKYKNGEQINVDDTVKYQQLNEALNEDDLDTANTTCNLFSSLSYIMITQSDLRGKIQILFYSPDGVSEILLQKNTSPTHS